jgi:hypothetical protein
MKSIVLAPILACALVSLPTWAQSTPAGGAPVAISKNTCDKPDEYPGKLASDNRRRAWQKTMDEYGACVKKYAADQRAIVDAAMKAGNEAVEEYNGVVNKAKEAIEKTKD